MRSRRDRRRAVAGLHFRLPIGHTQKGFDRFAVDVG